MNFVQRFLWSFVSTIVVACGGGGGTSGHGGGSGEDGDSYMPPKPTSINALLRADKTVLIRFESPPSRYGWSLGRFLPESTENPEEWIQLEEPGDYVDTLPLSIYARVVNDIHSNILGYKVASNRDYYVPDQGNAWVYAWVYVPPELEPPDTEPQYAGPGDEEAVLQMLDTVHNWTIRPVREPLEGEDLRVYHLVTTRRDNGFMATIISTTAVDVSCERRYVLEVRGGILRAGGMEGCEGFGTSFGFVRFLTEANKFSSFHSTTQVPNPPYEVVPREVE